MRHALAARGVTDSAQLELPLKDLHPPDAMPDIAGAARRLADAVAGDERILIVGDFDADGATSSALCISVLRAFGATHVDFLVPNRFDFGYGLTPELAQLALGRKPGVVVTVDNGVSSIAGIAKLNAHGVDVIVTDHHLPGDTLPAAHALVNPNLSGAQFPSRNTAGVAVAYYVLTATRKVLREDGHFQRRNIAEPKLADWLDLVAIGTIADVMPLDRNNRILVHQGLRRMRSTRIRPGVQALVRVAKRNPARLTAADIGFGVAPRLNAAGRLEDMSIGIRCLLAETADEADTLATRLNQLNIARREIESDMNDEAMAAMAESGSLGGSSEESPAICLYRPGWHQGLIGIVAGRLRERCNRPAIVFADASPDGDEIKGSARSIPGLHIRDALAECAAQDPSLIRAFGGHAMAAGLTIRRACLPRFRQAFCAAVLRHVDALDLAGIVVSDGELPGDQLTLDNAKLIASLGPWGQGFEEPTFHGDFEVVSERVVGVAHLKLVVKRDQRVVDAIAFNQSPVGSGRVRMVYRLGINDYRDVETLQLEVKAVQAL